MSTLELLHELAKPATTDLTETVSAPQAQVYRLDTAALSVIEQAIQDSEKLYDSIKRGRESTTALRCKTMVADFCLGLRDLQGFVSAMQAGDTSAAAKIPGLLKAFKESLRYSELLDGNKGYKKNGETVMAGYIYETIQTLSSGFDRVCDAVRPLSEAMEVEVVRMNVRSQLNEVAAYRFNTRAGIKTFGSPTVVSTKPAETPFKENELDWFDQGAGTNPAPAPVQSGYRGKIMNVLGDAATSIGQSILRTALVASLFSGGCTEAPSPVAPPVAPPAPRSVPRIPSVAPPVAPIATDADWEIKDTKNIWKAVDSAVAGKCPTLTQAQRVGRVAPMVHTALVAKTAGLTQVITAQQTRDTSGVWLAEVSTDEARYGNTIPKDYPGVLDSESSIRIAGAHGLDSATVEVYARSGLPAFATYNCN